MEKGQSNLRRKIIGPTKISLDSYRGLSTKVFFHLKWVTALIFLILSPFVRPFHKLYNYIIIAILLEITLLN